MHTEAANPATDPMLPRRHRVAAVRRECEGVVTLSLDPVDAPLPAALPGQFNMLYAFGIGEAAISYSGLPSAGAGMLHTIRAAGATTRALAALAPGAMVGVRGPFGIGWPVAPEAGRDLVIVAGGLGLAPLRPAILAALAGPGRPAIVYGTRSPEMILYRDEIEEWATAADLQLTVDHAAAGWSGRVGVVTACLPRALASRDPARVAALVCGPEIMMRFTAKALAQAGVPAAHIWLSMERNMKCGIGLCGHCQYGPDFICRDGPVLPYSRLAARLDLREV